MALLQYPLLSCLTSALGPPFPLIWCHWWVPHSLMLFTLWELGLLCLVVRNIELSSLCLCVVQHVSVWFLLSLLQQVGVELLILRCCLTWWCSVWPCVIQHVGVGLQTSCGIGNCVTNYYISVLLPLSSHCQAVLPLILCHPLLCWSFFHCGRVL